MEREGKTVRKRGLVAQLSLERDKGERARAIGLETARFQVPRVVRLDSDEGVLEFEWIPHLTTLKQLLLVGDPRVPQLLARAGGALAVVHDGLRLPDELKSGLPLEWMDPETNACLHGDFTADNVCIQDPKATLVIVDWSTAPILDTPGTYGSIYFDVLWFLYFLFQCTFPGKLGARKNLADAFLHGYASVTSRGLDAVKFDTFRRKLTVLQDRLVRRQTLTRPWFKKIPFRWRQWRRANAWQRYRLPEASLRG